MKKLNPKKVSRLVYQISELLANSGVNMPEGFAALLTVISVTCGSIDETGSAHESDTIRQFLRGSGEALTMAGHSQRGEMMATFERVLTSDHFLKSMQ